MFIFIGNAGGYLGLFLGYGILHIPELALAAYTWTRKRISERRQKSQDIDSAEEGVENKSASKWYFENGKWYR